MPPAPVGPAHILVVDDEPAITDLLATALRYTGYRVTTAATGHGALDAAASAAPDLVILDVMLPDLDGFEVCRRLRAAHDFVPVIFLSARDAEDDRIIGFVRGGDDYVTKPFSLEELTLRIAALLRRVRGTNGDGSARLRYRDLEMDEDRHQVWRAGREVELSPTEFRLLRYFLLNPERVLSKQQILDHVWQYDFNGEDNVVETYVSYLRRKVDDDGPKLLRTVRGFGYVLRADGGAPAPDRASMSLRGRLLISLAVMLAIALLASGVLLVALTRASLVDRVDRELQAVDGGVGQLQRLADLAASDNEAGRRLAVMRLDRQGNVMRSFPSGFATDPDPLPALPAYPAGIPADAYGRIVERPAVDGSMDYRVLTQQARPNLILAVAAPMASVDAAVATLVRTLLLTGAIAMIGLLAVAWVVVRRDLLPLERIARTAGEIAAGDLSHRAGVPHDGTEVGRLGTAFDAMLDQIESSFAQQQAAFEAKARSEERLRRFVADASHELRTPLTAVRGYADLYRAGGLADPDELATAMDRIGTESRRMGALVDDLLVLARLDQGRPIRHDAVDLSRVADDAVADARALEPDRPVVGAIDPGVVVDGDEDRLRQVVGNLLANVRVHTPAGSPVEVVVRAADAAAELRVVDHGPGIEEAHGASVFDRFYRADPGRSRDSGGTGLGLSIVASIVAAHGGQLWHEPTPGGGATFVVRIPLTASSQPAPGTGSATAPSL